LRDDTQAHIRFLAQARSAGCYAPAREE